MKQVDNRISKADLRHTRRFVRRQKACLKYGRVKTLGILEKALLRRAGRKDGEQGLPTSADDQIWSSPFLEAEVRGYQEFSAGMWAQLQLATQGTKVRIRQLKDTGTKEMLAACREALAAEKNARMPGDQPKKGEEHLSRPQILRRRQRELEQQILPLKNQMLALEGRLFREEEELVSLQSLVAELEHSTRLICDRVLQRSKQRIAVYWDAALKAQPDYPSLPLLPEIEYYQEAEERYAGKGCRLLYAAGTEEEAM